MFRNTQILSLIWNVHCKYSLSITIIYRTASICLWNSGNAVATQSSRTILLRWWCSRLNYQNWYWEQRYWTLSIRVLTEVFSNFFDSLWKVMRIFSLVIFIVVAMAMENNWLYCTLNGNVVLWEFHVLIQ